MSDTHNRLSAIEARLTRIESQLGVVPTAATQAPAPAVVASPWAAAAAVSSTVDAAPVAQGEQTGNWLGYVAVICFVVAAGFIIKLSLDSGWLTPSRQIGLALLLGVSLIGAGFALMRTDRAYASLLPAAGVIVLYLAAFGAHRLYGLISFEQALGLVSVVSGMCVWLYTQMKHDLYALTAAVGAYLAPVMLGLQPQAEFSFYYFLICSVAFAGLSIGVQSRLLVLVSAYLAMAMTAWVGFEIGQDRLVAMILALHFVVFSIGTYCYSTHHRTSLTMQEAWSFLPVLLAFYALEYDVLDRIQPTLAPWLSLAFSALLIGLYLLARRALPALAATCEAQGSQMLVIAFATVAGFHSLYLELLPPMAQSWLLVLLVLGFAFAPAQQDKRWYLPTLALLTIAIVEYLSMLYQLLEGADSAALLVSLAAFASLWVAIVKQPVAASMKERYGHTLLMAAHGLAIVGCYRLTTDLSSLAVSASWLCYAVGVMALAFHRRDEMMAKSALVVLAFAAGKALLYDAASAPTGVRIGCLLLTGAVLYGCGLLMRKIAGWKTPQA